MTRRALFTLVILAFPLGALGFLGARGTSLPLVRQDAWDRPLEPLGLGSRVAQSFEVPRPQSDLPVPGAIHALEMRIGTYRRRIEGRWELRLHRLDDDPPLLDLRSADLAVRRASLDLEEQRDNHPIRFRFEPLSVAAGDRLLAEVICVQSPSGEGATLWTRSEDLDPSTELLVDGRPREGELTYRVLGCLRGRSLARRVLGEVTWWKPRLADRPAVQILFGFAVLISAAAMILGLPEEED